MKSHKNLNDSFGFVALVFINHILSAMLFFLIPYIDYANIIRPRGKRKTQRL